jgi:DNA helicase II / ATP-dependent DNA helicase PcrA
MHEEILAGLNPAQLAAVTTIKGPVLVLAGPGSGKTRVLAHRVAYLLRAAGAQPRSLMAVTFTNKAAGEMRERINRLLGESVATSAGWRGLTIGTFHSICAYILRQEAAAAGINPNYVIFDDGEQLSALRQALRDLKLDDKMYRPEAMRSAISRAKNELIRPEQFEAPTYWAEVARRVYGRYEEIMAANNALDFDDLLARSAYLFRDNPEALARYQARYEYLLVDEFQDTNTAQYEWICHLAGKSHNLFAVGDEDQSIFAFRGADYRNVLRFRDDFPEAKVILLEQNYRSTQTILDTANSIIAHNMHRTPKKLRTDRGAGLQVTLHEAYDEADEANFVVSTIQQLVGRGDAVLSEIAVMYRTNAQSRPLEDAFVSRGLPYRLVGGTRFYQRKEIKDALAYVRLVHNPADNISLTRIINVPPRSIGEKTVSGLNTWSASLGVPMTDALALLSGDPKMAVRFPKPPEHPFTTAAQRSLTAFYKMYASWVTVRDKLTVAELLERITEESSYAAYLRDGTEEGEDRYNNLQELLTVAEQYNDFPPEDRLTAFLEEVALVSDQDQLAEEQDRVTLLTLHTAKGLEFKMVFIVGLEENIFPHSRSLEDPDQMEEERRLMYVGVTRAKDRLYLLHAFRRTLYGRSEVNAPSRFLEDIPESLQAGRDSASRISGARQLVQQRAREAAQSDATRWPTRSTPGAGMPNGGRQGNGSPGRGAGSLGNWSPGALPAKTPGKAGKGAAKDNAPTDGRKTQFKPGDRVDHGLFGQGIVLKVQLTADDEEVTVAFAGKGTKTLLASFARLRKV